jgi:hypothetical protein
MKKMIALGWLCPIFSFFSVFLLLATPDFDPQKWAQERDILITDANAPAAYLFVELDAPAYAGAREDFRDLRVIDEKGAQIPSKVTVEQEDSGEEERGAEMLDRTQGPDGSSRFTLDLGADPPRHNRLQLDTDSLNFSRRATIETSDDNRNWATARDDGYIFDFSRDTTARFLTIDYPVSTRRYLRVTIWNGREAPIRITDASIFFQAERLARLVQWPATLTNQGREAKQRVSIWRLDLGVAKLPQSRIELRTPTRNFHRHVEIEGSTDEKFWRSIDSGEIFSVALERINREQLWVEFPETRYRYLRLRVFDYDDQPLTFSEARVYGHPRRVLFQREPGRAYRLLYGNPAAEAPRYDIEQLSSYLNLRQLATVKLGAERRLPPPALPAAKPWYERQPLWLWATMGLATIAIGALIYRLAKLTTG